jgi:hypothetical protein
MKKCKGYEKVRVVGGVLFLMQGDD